MRARAGLLLRGAGLVLLGWILSRIEVARLWQLWAGMDMAQLWAVPFLGLAMTGVRALRWHGMLRLQNLQLPRWRAVLLYSSGIFLGSFTPGRLGDLGKAMYLRQEQGLSWEKALAGAVADRLLDLAVMLGLGCWALYQLDLVEANWVRWAGIGGGILMVGWFFAVSTKMVRESGFMAGLRRHRLARLVQGMAAEMAGLTGWSGVGMVALTAIAYGLYFFQTYLLARAQGLPLSAADLSAAVVLVGLASFLPVSVAGLGTREGILILILGQRGVAGSTEAGVAYSTLFFLACFVFPAAVGALCWLKVPLPLHAANETWR
ncbi:MAG: flippase-like domain-containing protein [Candidatus Latescibacteria bacterium]|nr:flippase-like domain-containing protein [Candidatus Latescibacterota bacterium]